MKKHNFVEVTFTFLGHLCVLFVDFDCFGGDFGAFKEV